MTLARATFAALVLACGAPAVGPSPSTPSGTTTAVAPSGGDALAVMVTEASYGRLALSTRPGARCEIVLDVARGQLGDGPPERTTETAGTTGTLVWSYPAPPQPAQRAGYAITCSAGDDRVVSTVAFRIAARELSAAAFTARVVAAEPAPSEIRPDPSLVPLRDAAIVALRSTLPREWAAATRGLGTLTLVEEPAEVLIKVIAARSLSVHVTAGDGTQEIRLFVADADGPESPENIVAVALHEIGHIWCCRGEGTEPGGHWAAAIADPELQGVDRFGLMNHPVTCEIFGSVESCPNRFSRRDLAAFGFTNISPPPPDPCLSRARPLEARLAELSVAVKARDASIAQQAAEIRALEARYPNGLPPAAYADYLARISRHNEDVRINNEQAATYNELVRQRNALPC